MAVTDRPFVLLAEASGWQDIESSAGVRLGATLQLQSLPGDPRPVADANGGFGGLTLPSTLALDRQGRIYILDGDIICRYDPCLGCFERLPTVGGSGHAPRRFLRPTGMTITRRNDLVVADSGNRRVQMFTLKGLVLRGLWGPFRVDATADGPAITPVRPARPDPCDAPGELTYAAGTWLPWDVAEDSAGWLYVSDHANGLVHRFDTLGCWRGAWDGVDNAGNRLARPTHLAVDCFDHLYVVQEGQAAVVVLAAGPKGDGRFVRHIAQPEKAGKDFAAGPIGFGADGRLYLTDARSGCVYVYDNAQTQACRCHAFKGRSAGLACAGDGQLLLADRLGSLLYTLHQDANVAAEGTIILGPLDSRRYRCPWHRVELDGRIEPATSVQVETFSADASKSDAQISLLPDHRWQTKVVNGTVGDGRWDCLVRSEPGRYLWVRLTLRSNSQQTPVIRAVRVFYPRQSSLQYLPAVYREDAQSAEFLDRFLSIMDSLWGGIGETIDNIAMLFDPMAAPVEFLAWLGSWLGLALEEHWPEAARRELIRQAHRLYALRGTPAGLKLHLSIYAGFEPAVLEHYRLRRWAFLNRARLGDQSVLWGDDIRDRLMLDEFSEIGEFRLLDHGTAQRDPYDVHAHQFSVYMPQLPASQASAGRRRSLERIIELSKPAHTQAHLILTEPGICVGRQVMVGVNTVIGCLPSGVVTGASHLGDGTLLSHPPDEFGPPSIQLGRRSRIGQDTRIDA